MICLTDGVALNFYTGVDYGCFHVHRYLSSFGYRIINLCFIHYDTVESALLDWRNASKPRQRPVGRGM